MLNMMMQHCLVGGDGRDSGRVALIDSSVFLEHPPPPIPPPPSSYSSSSSKGQPTHYVALSTSCHLFAQISYLSDKSHTIIYKCWEPF